MLATHRKIRCIVLSILYTYTALSYVHRYEEPFGGTTQHEWLFQSQPHNPHRPHHIWAAGKWLHVLSVLTCRSYPSDWSMCVYQIIPINNLQTTCFMRRNLHDRRPPHMQHKPIHRRVRTVTNSRLWYPREWVEIQVISVQKDIVFCRPYPELTN
jgi:hypothetical protein